MSKRRKEIREAEEDTEISSKKNKALLMAIMMIFAVGIASAVAAYYVYSSPGGGISPGDGGGGNPPDDGGSVPIVKNHMVIGELFVTTQCQYCAKTESDLKNLEQNRNDFYFVTMVADVNEDAYNRYQEISKQQGTPDTEFDGGRKGELGAVEPSYFINDIEYCKSTGVKDIRISGNARVLDNNHISVTVMLSTPEGSFSGHVRAFVIEKTSRYTNTNDEPIPNAFLGYALNEDVTVTGSNPYSKTMTWEGDYGNANNIAIVIAVYDADGMGVNAYRINL